MILKRLILLSMTIIGSSLWGATGVLPPITDMGSQQSKSFRPIFSGIYSTTKAVELRPEAVILNGELEENTTGATIRLEGQEPISIQTVGDQLVVSLLLSEEEIGQVPEKLILSQEEFWRAGLNFTMLGDEQTLAENFSPYVKTEIVRRGGRGRSGGVRARGRMHYMGARGCVAYVIKAIGWRGGRTGNGHEVTTTLRRHGWRRVSCNNPPVGAVASWSGGFHGAGHTAIWNGRCWKYDIACADPGRRYRLLECVAR